MWKSLLRGLQKPSGIRGLGGAFAEVLVEANGSLTKNFYSEQKQRWGWCSCFCQIYLISFLAPQCFGYMQGITFVVPSRQLVLLVDNAVMSDFVLCHIFESRSRICIFILFYIISAPFSLPSH